MQIACSGEAAVASDLLAAKTLGSLASANGSLRFHASARPFAVSYFKIGVAAGMSFCTLARTVSSSFISSRALRKSA